jgi:hypothetical protein
MRTPPEDKYDAEDLKQLKAEGWMVELLSLNPSYPHWGPREDYMVVRGQSWNSSQHFASWAEFGPWKLDELNECVNFYFELGRNSKPCATCDKSGLNPATKQIADDFYDFAERGKRWVDQITQDEVDALIAQDRLRKLVDGKWQSVPRTATEVNAANRRGSSNWDLDHDAINRWILIETRAKRLGVYGECSECEGKGHIYTEPKAHVNLVLWWLHPRKGCSRGIEVRITKADLPAVFAFLAEAAQRNAERFSKILPMVTT